MVRAAAALAIGHCAACPRCQRVYVCANTWSLQLSPLLQDITRAHSGKSVAQVVLRWALQRGQVVIPRSSSTTHIPENLQLFDFELSDAEMQAINGLDGTWKTGGLPLPVA